MYLPNGATVTELAAYYQDNSSGDMEIRLSLAQQGTGAVFGMAKVEVATTGTSSLFETAADHSIDDEVVNATTDRLYLILVMKVTEPSVDLRFLGARITYVAP